MEDYFNFAKSIVTDQANSIKENKPKKTTGLELILQHSKNVMDAYARVVEAEKKSPLHYQSELLDLTHTCELFIDNLRIEMKK